MKRVYLLMLCWSLLLATCHPKDPLPAETQTGQNTLGCKIGGKTYIPDGGRGSMPVKPVNGGLGIYSSQYKIGVYVRTYTKDKQRLNLYLNDFTLGPHVLNTTTGTAPALLDPADYAFYQASDGTEYVTSRQHTGVIILTKADTITGIVSGSFSFRAANASGQTVIITEGRFDVNARTQ